MNTDQTITRRVALIGTATATAVGPAPAVVMATEPEPDAELIRLGAEMEAAWAAERVIETEIEKDHSPEADARFEAAYDRVLAIVSRLEGTPARSLAGLRVKARAVQWCHNDDEVSFAHLDTTDMRLANSVILDLLSIGGKAVA